MIRNYFIVAIRNLIKFRFYSLINIFGLTVGIASVMVILLFVNYELSYDTHNNYADWIYRVAWELYMNGNHTH